MNCASKPGRLELNCPISAAAKTQNDPLLSEAPQLSRRHFGIANLRRGMRYSRVRAVTAASPEREPHNFNSRTDKFYET